MVRLDDVLGHEKQIDVLKVDIEGADTWAIMGAEGLLKDKRIKHIYYEENRNRMKKLGIKEGEAQAFLESQGYRVESIGHDNGALAEFYATPK